MSGNNENNTEKDLSEKEKKILEDLYRCRDLELNNLWQKAIFLGPFLILCFIGYGFLLYDLSKEFSIEITVLCIALCFICFISSMLWIYMFKDSKIQYKLCEIAIANYEEKLKLSTKAGKFSPSEINIVIGQVSLWIWIYCFSFHFMFFLYEMPEIFLPQKDILIINIIRIIIIAPIIILLFYSYIFDYAERISGLSSSNEEIIRAVLNIVSEKKTENKDGKCVKHIITDNQALLECLQEIYEVDCELLPQFTEKEKIYLDAYRYLVELGKVDDSKQKLFFLFLLLGIKEKRAKELEEYIREQYQK